MKRLAWWSALVIVVLLTVPSAMAQTQPAPPQTQPKQPQPAQPQPTQSQPAQPQPQTQPVPQAQPAPMQPAATLPIPAGTDYIIGAEDVLDIQVWGSKDLNQTVFVRPDGRLSPAPRWRDRGGGQDRPASSRTTSCPSTTKTVKGAMVTVIVKEIKSRPVYFVGGFGKPGVMQLTGDLTLLQGISRWAVSAGGGRGEWISP